MKKCQNCGHENADGYDFCIKCGADLRSISSAQTTLPSQPSDSQPIKNQGGARFKLLEENLAPADSELEVRTYHCTSFKSLLLSLNAEGYLVVTNKRVVFHAFGTSFAGKSILQSEVPIEDVSGISIYKGSYFSLTHLLGAFFLSIFFGNVVITILASIILALARFFLQDQSLINLDVESLETTAKVLYLALQVLLWILAFASLVISFFLSKQSIFRSAFATLAAFTLTVLGSLSYISNEIQDYLNSEQSTGGSGFVLVLAMFVVIYALVCFFWYSRRPTMSLAVGSKGGSSTPIAISGISSFGIYNTAASKALSAEPAEDAEALVKELGAMVMDIQTLGDLGVNQWRAK
ncbi:MAG: zinc-ribbon domain-containing protein [Anaerolineales bacterium]|nr:zinc-ribbon domain-containing protein [Anaerolineales bacterium]